MAPDEHTGPAAAQDAGHVFISHHSSQYEAAKRVKTALAAAGVASWLAPDNVDPGSAFDVQILDAIRTARAVVLLLCAESDRSRHVKREVMLADDADKPVFPVRLEEVKAQGLAYWLKDYQWIDWIGGKGDGLARLVDAVGETLALPAALGRAEVRKAPPYLSRRRLLIAAGAGAAVLAGGAAWFYAAGPASAEPYVKPGLWLNKREMIALTYPVNVAPEETRQIKDMVENDPNPEECITEAVALKPDVNLFDPGNKGGCALNGFQIGSGRTSGYLVCPVRGVKDASMSIVFQGTYTQDSIVMESDVTIGQPGGSLRFKARDSSHWVADECPAQNR